MKWQTSILLTRAMVRLEATYVRFDGIKFGVPKHSELEPHYLVAKRTGNSASKCGLIRTLT